MRFTYPTYGFALRSDLVSVARNAALPASANQNSPSTEGWQAQPDGVVLVGWVLGCFSGEFIGPT